MVLLTVREVADQLGVSQGLVYKLIRNGDLESHRIGSAIRVSAQQVEEYLERSRSIGAPEVSTEFRHLKL